MKRAAMVAASLAVSSLVSFGAGGWVALDAERSKTSTAPATKPSSTQFYQPTETKIIHKTIEHEVTVDKLSDDCRELVERTELLYEALSAFSTDKARLQVVLDHVGSSIVRQDKGELNKAHVEMAKLDRDLQDGLHLIAETRFSANQYADRCSS